MIPNRNAALRRWLIFAGVFVVVSGASEFSAVMALMPGQRGTRSAAAPNVPLTAPLQPDGVDRIAPKCAECGIVESAQEIEQVGSEVDDRVAGVAAPKVPPTTLLTPAKVYQLTLRMGDGTSRVLTRTSPWDRRSGTRVVIIEGNGDAAE
jgi:hypothetical protein